MIQEKQLIAYQSNSSAKHTPGSQDEGIGTRPSDSGVFWMHPRTLSQQMNSQLSPEKSLVTYALRGPESNQMCYKFFCQFFVTHPWF